MDIDTEINMFVKLRSYHRFALLLSQHRTRSYSTGTLILTYKVQFKRS